METSAEDFEARAADWLARIVRHMGRKGAQQTLRYASAAWEEGMAGITLEHDGADGTPSYILELSDDVVSVGYGSEKPCLVPLAVFRQLAESEVVGGSQPA